MSSDFAHLNFKSKEQSYMKLNIKQYRQLRPYLMLWSTQSLSALGSSMTSFALVIWLYQRSGSALETAMLSICSYAPYVVMSIFAGALSDRWDKRRTMLACDLSAALCTIVVLLLLRADALQPWHMYVLNAISGLMNTVQQPASDVATTRLVPREYYQQTCGLRSFSQSLNTILTPALASALFAFAGMELVIAVDLITFGIAFATLGLFIRIPDAAKVDMAREKLLDSARAGLAWLRRNRLILHLIMFLAWINLVASAYEAALPAMILPRAGGGETALGLVNSCGGVAMLLGSLAATLLPAPRNRVRALCLALMVAMGTENFMLALGRTPLIWCVGSVLGWITIPIMNAQLDVINRSTIPVDMQGRVYSCRNALQFFTIPLGYFFGGLLIDKVCEPLMATLGPDSVLVRLLGSGKGSGAALMLLLLGFAGVAVCVAYWRILRGYDWREPAGVTSRGI